MKLKNWIINNLGLKLIALALALTSWAYIAFELQEVGGAPQFLARLRAPFLYAKNLPVVVVLTGATQQGFRVNRDKMVVEPDYCILIGPKSVVENLKYVKTKPVDITGKNKTFTQKVALDAVASYVVEGNIIEVQVVIEKL